ncbi:MAG TPA: ArsA family ATPase [Acidimicrobiia bacterium]|nr:ArsA family ATPase [Acidimicrobiia bacterium]
MTSASSVRRPAQPRIVLVTGKGGVGKTSVAAATALAAAEAGYRTLVSSTDPAHSLGDALAVGLGDDPVRVIDGLDGQQIDTQRQLDRYWGSIRQQLMNVLDWGGVSGLEAEEFLIFPGMDELFALLEVNRHARSGDYDALIVDCAPTAETLRLLSLPEVLSWYFDRILPTERRILRAARPLLTRVTDLPVPEDKVFDAASTIFSGVEQVKELLGRPDVTSARLVVNPEKMVIDEARRTFTYLSLFGYGVDSVIVNRVLPEEVSDPYFSRWHTIQKGHLDAVDAGFADVPRLRLRLFDDEMVGVERLLRMARELYGDHDPVADFAAHNPFEIRERDGRVVLYMQVPFVERGDLDVYRQGTDLYVQVGAYRRSFVLPDSLQRRAVETARLEDDKLAIHFGEVS